ncbi:mammalian ependymin-related protein 1-like [Mya arenaria]|uniref:mammalian ependymin-related protein 1-like n=1 Tax=Mya arenaria TaxID=6604 RepID=UPI0022E399DC|nr:mammalian ependymin-related protein 1-like [Mya arenaria]
MLKLLIAASLVVVCLGQVPTRCDSPKQWVGRRLRLDRYREYGELASHSYDELNMRTRTIEEVEQGREKDYYDTLHLHNVKMEYRLNLRTKQCNVTRLDRPFRFLGVPLDAKFLFEAEIGAAGIPAEHLLTDTWYGTFEDGARYTVSVSSPDCIPLTFDVESNSTDEHYHERYFDVHLGISDPGVFIPPKECMMDVE